MLPTEKSPIGITPGPHATPSGTLDAGAERGGAGVPESVDRRAGDRRAAPDSIDSKRVRRALEAELAFLESGGYHSHPRTPDLPTPVFKLSPLCPNRGTEHGDCSGCILHSFVPPERRGEAVPCHFIPLDDKGRTAHEMATGSQREVENAVAAWIRKTLKTLERECT
ncbi:MAG: hypothetical protein HYX26_01785 [Acidobacteriales bacterium]|nr:hypothetical protein [Terriglobales bacterium]